MTSFRLSWEKFLLLAIKGGVFLILLTPLVFSDRFFYPTLAPQTLYFRVLVELVFALYLLLVLESRTYLPRISPLFIALAAFLSALALSTIFGIHPAQSFWGTFNRLEGFIAFIHYGLFFLILSGVFKQAKEWTSFFRFSLLASIPVGIFGVLEYLFIIDFLPDGVDWTRLSGTLGNPSLYGSYLVSLIFIGILLIMLEKRNSWKIAWLAITIFNGMFLLLSGTRGAWLALTVGIGTLFLLWAFFSRGRSKIIPLRSALIGLAVLLGVFFAFVLAFQAEILPSNIFWERYQFAWTELNALENQRFTYWPIAIEAWQKSPLLGYGLESFIHLYDTYYKPSFTATIPQTSFFDRTHNAFLEFLVASGAIGLLAYLAVFANAFIMLWRSFRNSGSIIAFVLVAFLIAYLTQTMFIFDITPTYMLLFFMLGFIHISCTETHKPAIQTTSSASTKKRIAFGISIFTLAIFLGYAANQGIALAHITLAEGKHSLQALQSTAAFEQYAKACTYGPPSIQLGACRQSIRQFIVDPFQQFYAPEVQQERERYLKNILEQFEQHLAANDGRAQILHYMEIADGYRNLYLHTENPDYLAAEGQALEKAKRINPLFPQLSD